MDYSLWQTDVIISQLVFICFFKLIVSVRLLFSGVDGEEITVTLITWTQTQPQINADVAQYVLDVQISKRFLSETYQFKR